MIITQLLYVLNSEKKTEQILKLTNTGETKIEGISSALFKWIKKSEWNRPFSRKILFNKTNAGTYRKFRESNSMQ